MIRRARSSTISQAHLEGFSAISKALLDHKIVVVGIVQSIQEEVQVETPFSLENVSIGGEPAYEDYIEKPLMM